MNISGIDFESIADGEGVRVVIYVSGCKHNCKGCHNPCALPFDAGQPFTKKIENQVIEYIKSTPFISGLTLSGGDPMFSAKELIPFINRIEKLNRKVSVWIYSGFTYEEIIRDEDMFNLLKQCDVLIDGRFVLEQRDITLPYRGSSNQRVIDVKETLRTGHIVLWGGIE